MIKRYITKIIESSSNRVSKRYYNSSNHSSINNSNNIKYSKNHTWVSIPNKLDNHNSFEISVPEDSSGSGSGNDENDIIVTFGLTEEFINSNTKNDDILYIKFPLIDNHGIIINKECITIETMSDHFTINSPLSGKVIEINQELLDYPNDLNIDPLKNWLAKLSISNSNGSGSNSNSSGSSNELNQLMNREEYKKYCENNLIK